MEILLDDPASIDQLVVQAEQFVERRSPDALPLAEEIMKYAIRNGSPRHFAQANYIFAFYNCLVANDYEKAISFCEEVLTKLDEEEIIGIVYKIYMTMGNSYQLKGEVFMAQESYMKGLKQLEAKKELTRSEKGFLGTFYYNLSLLLSTTELNMDSEEYLERAIALFQETENNFKLSKSYHAYAGVFERKSEYYKAIDMLYKSLEIDLSSNDLYSIALSKANLGVLHLRIRDFDQAFTYINDALAYYDDQKMLWEAAMVKVALGEALHAVGRKTEAIIALLQSEELFTKLENKNELTKTHQLLSNYVAEKGNFEMALDYHRKYTEGLKYFFDVEKTKALTHAKKEFESEQKEKEAAILREKNEEIKHYVLKLERSNNELNQFANIASHDLREPLRMVSSYMMLLQKSLGTALNEQQNQFVTFAIDGARRMDLLIQDMLRLAKVDANPRIEHVSFNMAIEEIKMNLEVLTKEKNAMIMHTDLPDVMADRTMVLQLFQNIIGNGIKYNESQQPTIKIKHRIYKNEVEVTVADNGIGIPVHLREKAFQIFQRLPTTKQYSGTGIGLAICKKIVESLEGKIYIEDNPTGGTIFRMVFPKQILHQA
jgi:signal transduction histidine kinase